MPNLTSLSHLVISRLKQSPGSKLSARELARQIIAENPQAFSQKRANPRFADDKAFENQIVAEIGSQLPQMRKKAPNIHTRDKPRPRLYYYSDDSDDEPEQATSATAITTETAVAGSLSELALYPLLIEYLHAEFQLYSLRIDEKKSKNSKGAGGNRWLHPDVVAMEPLDQNWQESIQTCVRSGNGKSVRLWSFEVKKELTRGNVRQHFFQAVSNSSWANLGYLVATGLSDDVEKELQMLCALHGIGLLLLDAEDPLKSEVIIPAKEKADIDWQSANRIVEQNQDFKRFIELVGMYHQTGKIIDEVWNL